MCTFNIGHHVSLLTTTVKHGPSRLLKFTWWLLLVRISKMKLPLSFWVYRLAVRLFCGFSDATIGQPANSLDLTLGTYPPPYLASPPYIIISILEMYIASSTNSWMFRCGNTMGVVLNPVFCNLYQSIHTLDLKYSRSKHLPFLLISCVGVACVLWFIIDVKLDV